MGLYIRKSVKFGPIRFNFSKSGIGVSAGVKGARISTGPRGTYINIGGNGIYYRQKIDGSVADVSPKSQTGSSYNPEKPDGLITTASVSDLVESSNEALLSQINSRIQQPTYAFLVGLVSIVLAGAIAYLSSIVQSNVNIIMEEIYPILFILPLILGGLVLIFGISIALETNKQETLERTTTLLYELDTDAESKFCTLQQSLANLAEASRIWRVISRTPTWDWKRNAGALTSITRSRIIVKNINPPFIQSNINIYGLIIGSMNIYFFPDQILVYQSGKYGAVSCNSLQVNSSPTSFVEEDGVPFDSTILYYTWRYVRRDGGPDKRFNNNRKIPVAEYGHIEISSKSGMNVHLHVSSLSNAQQFERTLSSYILYRQNLKQMPTLDASSRIIQSSGFRKIDSAIGDKPLKNKKEDLYAVLKLSPNASKDEITAAYMELSRLYHPEKVAKLSPEFHERARKRLAAINSAYKQLMITFK